MPKEKQAQFNKDLSPINEEPLTAPCEPEKGTNEEEVPEKQCAYSRYNNKQYGYNCDPTSFFTIIKDGVVWSYVCKRHKEESISNAFTQGAKTVTIEVGKKL